MHTLSSFTEATWTRNVNESIIVQVFLEDHHHSSPSYIYNEEYIGINKHINGYTICICWNIFYAYVDKSPPQLHEWKTNNKCFFFYFFRRKFANNWLARAGSEAQYNEMFRANENTCTHITYKMLEMFTLAKFWTR